MKNTSAISSPFVTIKRAAAFKSQPRTNNALQVSEQKANVLALFFIAVACLPLGQCLRVYKPCRKESLPWTPHKSVHQLDLSAFLQEVMGSDPTNNTEQERAVMSVWWDNGQGISAVTPVMPLSDQF